MDSPGRNNSLWLQHDDALSTGDKEEARQQLKALPKEQRRNVGRRLDALQLDLSGDVKKLTAKTHEYRLRVGTLRVLFTLEKT